MDFVRSGVCECPAVVSGRGRCRDSKRAMGRQAWKLVHIMLRPARPYLVPCGHFITIKDGNS